MNRNFLLAVGLLAGTIIGAGIFSLPYLFNSLGIFLASAYLFGFAFVYFIIHLMYAELVKKHHGSHEFFYLSKNYLPKRLSRLAPGIIIAELILVLVAYLTLAPSFLNLMFGFGYTTAAFIMWFLGSVFMFIKLRWLGIAEIFGILGILIIVFLIFFSGNSSVSSFYPQSLNFSLLILPFAPLLFSFSGRPAISRVVDEHNKSVSDKKPFNLKRAILIGTLIPAVVYLLFVVSVLRLSPNATPDTISGLSAIPGISHLLLFVIGILGFIAIWTSYFIIGINVKEILTEDMKLPSAFGGLVAVLVPLILYLSGLKNFLEVVAFTGGVFLALEGVFVIMMWRKAFYESPWRKASIFLYPVFLTALAYQVYSFIV